MKSLFLLAELLGYQAEVGMYDRVFISDVYSVKMFENTQDSVEWLSARYCDEHGILV